MRDDTGAAAPDGNRGASGATPAITQAAIGAARSGGPPDDAGFSLLEVAVAVVLLAVGALAVARGMGSAIASGTSAGQQTRATALAVDKLEYLKSRPAADVDDEPARRIDARGRPDADGPYLREVTVKDASEGSRPNTKEVTVTVEYTAGGAGAEDVELFTILFVNDT